MKKNNSENSLIIKDLHASVAGKEILKGVNLIINPGETHALMGPNGSGKSTLSNLLAGHPRYVATKGRVLFNGQNILELAPEERAKMGIFLAFQYPVEITGVSLFNFLKTAYSSVKGKIDYAQFSQFLKEEAVKLKVDPKFLSRYLNEGFSGGEKKKAEILQMLVLSPKMVILDETDSGLDIDALKVVAEGINRLREERLREASSTPGVGVRPQGRLPEFSRPQTKPGILLVTHYFRILNYVKPDFVHVFLDGKIAKSGGAELANQLEEKGYEWVKGSKQVDVMPN